jgi:hypothetical protein
MTWLHDIVAEGNDPTVLQECLRGFAVFCLALLLTACSNRLAGRLLKRAFRYGSPQGLP